MAKHKMSENSLKNLKPLNLTHEEAVKNGKKGGKKSVEVRREKRLLQQVVEEKLNKLYPDGKTFQEKSIDLIEDMILTGILKPDDLIKLLTFLRDTAGQKPTDKQEINTNQPAILATISEKKIEEVFKRVNGLVNE